MPAPPASATAADLSTRAPPPRSQTTILPSALAASSDPVSHRAAALRATPAAAASAPSTRPVDLTGWSETIAPTYEDPFPSRTAPWNSWWVLAATVVTQGATCVTDPGVAPRLPAEVVTNTPAEAAPRKARSTEPSCSTL